MHCTELYIMSQGMHAITDACAEFITSPQCKVYHITTVQSPCQTRRLSCRASHLPAINAAASPVARSLFGGKANKRDTRRKESERTSGNQKAMMATAWSRYWPRTSETTFQRALGSEPGKIAKHLRFSGSRLEIRRDGVGCGGQNQAVHGRGALLSPLPAVWLPMAFPCAKSRQGVGSHSPFALVAVWAPPRYRAGLAWAAGPPARLLVWFARTLSPTFVRCLRGAAVPRRPTWMTLKTT